MLRRLRTEPDRSEDGFAIAVVMLAGMILVLITAIVMSRAARQVGTVSGDVRWEQSLHVAESCLDVGLVTLSTDLGWTTGETLDLGDIGARAERDWAVASADGQLSGDLVTTPEGDCAIVKPSNADLLFAVGFAPSRSATERRVRVVRAALTPAPSSIAITRAFLTNDELELEGNPTFIGIAASAHTNSSVEVEGNATFQSGCLTSSTGGEVDGNLNVHSSCPPTPFDEPVIEIPAVEPRDFWYLSEYDMCPDGGVYAGPAHPTLGGTVGAEPCTGLVIEPDASSGYRGWVFDGCCDSEDWAEWSYGGNTANDGAYYFYWGTPDVVGSPGTNNDPWEVLIMAEAKGICPDRLGGDVFLNGNMAIGAYQAGSAHASNTFVVLAGRDVGWEGNGKLTTPGIVAATEQIEIDGNVDVEGAFVAEGRCDSEESHIDDTEIEGNPTFRLDGSLQSLWQSLPVGLAVLGWDEL